MPTPAEKNGDFSQLLALGSQYQIYDPNDESQQWTLQSAPFPGNIVPQSQISAMAKKVLAPLPNPNGAPSPTREGLNNYIYEAGSSINDYWSLSTRIDHNFNGKNHLFGRFGWSDRVLNGNSNDYCKGRSGGDSKGVAKLGALDFSHVFDAQTVFDIRHGYTRQYSGIKSLTRERLARLLPPKRPAGKFSSRCICDSKAAYNFGE